MNTPAGRVAAALLAFSLVLLTNCSSEIGTSSGSDAADAGPLGGMKRPAVSCDDAGNCSCPASLVACGSVCVDLSSDEAHCGECREACDDGAVCKSGTCQCPQGKTECDGACVDLDSSFEHCGQCGDDCGQGERCASGSCKPLMCTGGKVACSGSCVDLSQDTRHCGGCGEECLPDEICESGVCNCPPGDAVCNSVGNDGELVGGDCSSDANCANRSECLKGGDFPAGTCSVSCDRQADCPAGTRCVDERGGICLLSCSRQENCRDGYNCERVDAQGGGGEPRVCIQD